MEHASEYFIDKGGHDYSGGFSVSHEHIHFLEEALIDAVGNITPVASALETPHVITISLKEISDSFLESIEKLRPFGEGNKKPYLKIAPVTVVEVSQFGKNAEHVRVVCVDDKGTKREAIAFFTRPTDFSIIPEVGKKLVIMGNIEGGTFMGRKSIRIRLIDLQEE